MKSARTKIGIFQKMRIKNLRGSVRSDFKKLDSFTLETSKNHLIRKFLRNGRLMVKRCGKSEMPDFPSVSKLYFLSFNALPIAAFSSTENSSF